MDESAYPLIDLHTHTTHSDGRNGLELNVQGAEAVGLATVATTDHYNARMRWPIDAVLAEVQEVRRTANVELLSGAELHVLDVEGTLSMEPEDRAKFDVILVEMYHGTEGIFDGSGRLVFENLARCVDNFCRRNEYVDVFAHPFNVLGPKGIDLDAFPEEILRQIAASLRETGVAFEIMSDQWFWFRRSVPIARLTEQYLRIVRIMNDEGVLFSFGSDAHSHQGVGNVAWSKRLAARAGIAPERIITSESLRRRRLRNTG